MTLPDKVRVDFAEITFAELADALDVCGVGDLTRASGAEQARANAAFAWVVLRRDDPDVEYADVLRMPVQSVEVVGADDPGNALGASDGGTRPASGAPGGSDLST